MSSRRFIISAMLGVSLVACGGGGGGSSSVPSSGGGGTQTQSPVQSVTVQRTLATQTLESADATSQLFTFGGAGSGTVAVTRRAIHAAAKRVVGNYRPGIETTPRGVRAAAVPWGACANSSESATVVVSPSEEQLYTRTFFDAACAHLYQDSYLDIIATSTTNATATGTIAAYNLSGAEMSYDTLSMALTGFGTSTPTFSLHMTTAASATGPQLADIGVSCDEGTASLGCGFGAVDHDQTAASDLGATVTVTAAVGTTQSGLTNVSVNGSAAGYSGALDTLKLAAGTAPNWAISGGTTTDSATLTGALAFNSLGMASSGTMTVTDSADQGSVTFTATSTGDTGAITDTATGKAVATFTVDQSGNGTATFSNGTTAQISAWQLLG